MVKVIWSFSIFETMVTIENTQECFVMLWRKLKHRELLRAIVSVQLGISYWKVNLKALDKAYSIAFPNSTPINVNKK